MLTKDTAKTASAPSRLKQFAQYLALLIVTLVLGVGVYFLVAIGSPEQRSVKVGDEVFTLEIASDNKTRVQGLSGRISLSQNTGMLFDFGKLGDWQIWMKDMHFDIDILWLDETGKVVGIETKVAPSTYPNTFEATVPSRYVIELPADTVDRTGTKINDVIDLRQL